MTFYQFLFKLCISLLVLEIGEHYLQFSACRPPSKLAHSSVNETTFKQTNTHTYSIFNTLSEFQYPEMYIVSPNCFIERTEILCIHDIAIEQDMNKGHPYFFLSLADICLFLSILVSCTLQGFYDWYLIFHFEISEEIQYSYCLLLFKTKFSTSRQLEDYLAHLNSNWTSGNENKHEKSVVDHNCYSFRYHIKHVVICWWSDHHSEKQRWLTESII